MESLRQLRRSFLEWIAPIGPPWKAVLIAGLAASVAYTILRVIDLDWWLQAILVSGVLVGWHLTRERPIQRFAVLWVAFGIAIALAAGTVGLIEDRIVAPPFWDFTVFWILGRVAEAGGPIYDPSLGLEFGRLLGAPDSFFREFQVFYPPPFLVLLLPLGRLDLAAASMPWYLVQLDALILAIIAIWRVLLAREGWPGLVLAAVLVLAMPATGATFSLGQTNLFLLLFAVLLLRPGDRRLTGVSIALGTLIKPFFAVLFLLPLLRRQWRAVIAAVVTGVAILLVTTDVLGIDVWTDFLTRGIGQVQAYPFSQNVNQSLLAGTVRIIGRGPDELLLVAGVLILTAVIFIVQLLTDAEADHERVPGGLIVASVMAITLLLYPATLGHYYLLLVAPLTYLWSERTRWGIDPLVLAVLIGVVYGLVGAQSGHFALLGGLLTLALLIWITADALGRRPPMAEQIGDLGRRIRAASIRKRADSVAE